MAPPSVVTVNVPPVPLAHATRLLTGLIAWSRWVVPLDWGVSLGVVALVAGSMAGTEEGSELSEQASVAAAVRPTSTAAKDEVRIMGVSDKKKGEQRCRGQPISCRE